MVLANPCVQAIHSLVVVESRSLMIPSEVNDKADSHCPISSRHRNYYSEAVDDNFCLAYENQFKKRTFMFELRLTASDVLYRNITYCEDDMGSESF